MDFGLSANRLTMVLFCGLIANWLTTPASAQDSCSVSRNYFAGLWQRQLDFGPAVKGALAIRKSGIAWSATIDDFRVPIDRAAENLVFSLPAGQGSFRGMVLPDGTISGMWRQPVPVRSIYPFESPVHLAPTSETVWTGIVKPLPDRLTMYLEVSVNDPNDVTAFFRDSEVDLEGGKQFSVQCQNTQITLVNVKDAKDVIHGDVHADAKQISLRINLDDASQIYTFDFSRVSPASAKGFFAVVPGTAPYVYQEPFPDEDGWPVSEPAEVGMSADRLADAVRSIESTPIDGSDSPHIEALVVARHGKLVLDSYFFGYTREQTHDLRSTGKSFTTALIGIAAKDHPELKVDSPILPFFSGYHPKNIDARKQRIKVRDLLTMTSGLDCNDGSRTSLGREMALFTQTAQPDYYAYTLDLPMIAEPGGTHAIYCSASINLLGGIIKAVSRQNLADYFNQKLAIPLQFKNYQLNLSPNGDMYMGGGFYLRARDALKLGQVYLDGGSWLGKHIVDADWIKQSSSIQSSYSDYHGYGFGWHVFNRLELNGHEYHEFETEGTGGQLVIVIPELDLAVTMFTANYSRDMTDPERVVLAKVVQAITDK